MRVRNVGLVINLKFLTLCRFSLTLPLRDKRLPRLPCPSGRARRGCSRGQGLRCALRGAPRLQEVVALDSSGAAGPRGRRAAPPALRPPALQLPPCPPPGRASLPLGPHPCLVLPPLALCTCVPPTMCNEVIEGSPGGGAPGETFMGGPAREGDACGGAGDELRLPSRGFTPGVTRTRDQTLPPPPGRGGPMLRRGSSSCWNVPEGLGAGLLAIYPSFYFLTPQ